MLLLYKGENMEDKVYIFAFIAIIIGVLALIEPFIFSILRAFCKTHKCRMLCYDVSTVVLNIICVLLVIDGLLMLLAMGGLL